MNKKQWSPFSLACRYGNCEMIVFLIGIGLDILVEDVYELIFLSCYSNNINTLGYLLNYKIFFSQKELKSLSTVCIMLKNYYFSYIFFVLGACYSKDKISKTQEDKENNSQERGIIYLREFFKNDVELNTFLENYNKFKTELKSKLKKSGISLSKLLAKINSNNNLSNDTEIKDFLQNLITVNN